MDGRVVKIKSNWQSVINEEQQKSYYLHMEQELSKQYQQGEVIFPAKQDIFNAFSYVDLPEVKVVILGQDPYHGTSATGEAQAHGLAFSVRDGCKIPPSLVNIYKELSQDIKDFTAANHSDLSHWAEQGVLLLNTVLTVKQGLAHSHAKLGWEAFTDSIIQAINEKNSGCVFMLWGSHAQKKGKNINQEKHLVLVGPHPSPLSAYRGFFGCQHFSKANQWLTDNSLDEIKW